MKVIIPVAGIGSRLKPHTFTTPKPLMEVGGKTIIERVLEDVKKLNPTEIIFIVNYKKDMIEKYIKDNFKNLRCSFVEQENRDGDGDAIRCGLEKLTKDEEVFVVFGADTLIDFDIKKSILKNKLVDALIYTKEVEDPSHYGVVNHDKNLRIHAVEEKPEKPQSNLAIIGAYYFKSLLRLKDYLEYFKREGIKEKGEYKLVQAIRRYIEDNDSMVKAYKVDEWFDCGRPEILLESNKYFLKKTSKIKKAIVEGTALIVPPCYIHKSAVIKNSVIGPYVSIGKDAKLENVAISNSIVGDSSQIKNIVLSNSLIGKEVLLKHRLKQINMGDKSEIIFE